MENKETLEEAAKKYIGFPLNKNIDEEQKYFNPNVKTYDAFIKGAKWAQERMHSEVDIYSLLDFIRNNAFETDKGWQINKIVYTNEELLEYFKSK